MYLSHLSLTNVRNFIRLELDLPSGSLLVVGGNAQGKTSLLEAIYYLASASSPHTTHDRELISFLALREAPIFARLAAEVHRAGRLERVEMRLLLERPSPSDDLHLRRELLLNGIKRRPVELASGLNAVLFVPQDLRVLEGPPAERRRYLDAALAQADIHYAPSLQEYSQVLAQRNALLKQLQEAGPTPASRRANGSIADSLAFWDERLAALGTGLMRARALALAELDHLAAPIHSNLTDGAEHFRLDYLPSFNPLPAPHGQLGLPIEAPVDHSSIPLAELQAGLLAALENSRAEDIQRGQTQIGPHRDDFRIRLNGIDSRTYGSRGQNRTAMMAMKLAEVEWMHQRTGEWPVLLLDEVLAELDPSRRIALLRRVDAADQAILTSSDPAMFGEDFRRRATVWRIEAGTIHPW